MSELVAKLSVPLPNDGDATASADNKSVQSNLPVNDEEWMDLFVREMMSATSVDDATVCASTSLLEILEISISKHAAEDTAQSLQKVSICVTDVSFMDTMLCRGCYTTRMLRLVIFLSA